MKGFSCTIIFSLLISLIKDVSGQLPLGHDKSWEIRSIINVPEYRVSVHETYSGDYSYSIIRSSYHNYSYNSKKKNKEFHLDNQRDIFLIHDREENTCDTSNRNEFYANLGLPNIYMIKLNKREVSERVLGPVRLLYFIEEHKDKLMLVDLEEKDYVRNTHCLQYKLNFITEDGFEVNYIVFYKATLVAQNIDSLPIQVMLNSARGSICIDFFHITYPLDLPDPGSALFHDRFVLPPSCTQALAIQKRDVNVFKDLKMNRFSFEANVKTILGQENKKLSNSNLLLSFIYVNYDLDLSTLKVSKRNSEDTTITHEVTNYKVQKTHLITPEKQPGKSAENSFSERCTIFSMPSLFVEEPEIRLVLLGANTLVPLGKAYVRGVASTIYAVMESSIPMWLDLPTELKTNEKKFIRQPDIGTQPRSKNARNNVTTLVYLSNQEVPHLMYMTLQHNINLHLIEVFNFNWDIDHSESTSEIFSLHESCSSFKKAHNHVNLLLSSLKSEKLPEKPGPLMMDLTLLAALQHTLMLPVTMVYDLSYKFLNENLLVSMNVASYQNLVTELVYLGLGHKNQKFTGPMLVERVQSFQTCYRLAGIRNSAVFFAFDLQTYTCSIDLESEGLTSFNLEAGEGNGPLLEIYQVTHATLKKVPFGRRVGTSWLEDQLRDFKAHKLVGTRLQLYPFSPESKSYTYTLESIKFYPFQPEDSRFVKSINNSIDTNSFVGFGLPENAENRRILLPSSRSRSWSSKENEIDSQLMSFSQCQSACMSNSQCKSFSVCQKSYELECVISENDFRSSNVTEQLVKLSSDATDDLRKQVVQVTLDNEKIVNLIKRPYCELHNKVYLNLFHPGWSYIYMLGNEMLQQVTGIEACAKLCVELNMFTLSEDAKLSEQLKELASNRKDLSEDQLQKFKLILKSRDDNSDLLCKEFLYLDKSQIPPDETALKEIEERALETSLNPSEVRGFCKISAYKGKVSGSSLSQSSARLNFHRFEFILESFYEGLKGVKLRASPMSKEDAIAYDRVKFKSNSLNLTNYLRLQQLIESGHNFQESFYGSEWKCAAFCFLGGSFGHSMGPWPSCRSYDIEVDSTMAKTCHLNSQTIKDVIRNEKLDLLIESESRSGSVYTHYEPSIALQEATPDGTHKLIELELQVHTDDSKFKLHSASLLIISILATCCGLLLGVKLALQLVDRVAPTNETNNMRARLTDLEFTNQVNANGLSNRYNTEHNMVEPVMLVGVLGVAFLSDAALMALMLMISANSKRIASLICWSATSKLTSTDNKSKIPTISDQIITYHSTTRNDEYK